MSESETYNESESEKLISDAKEIIADPYPTWKEIVSHKEGRIYKDWTDQGIRCIIMRGPSSLCAYAGVLSDHPLANMKYDDVPIYCHGGLTFDGPGGDGLRPEGYFWYGWDYGHSGDYSFYYDDPRMSRVFSNSLYRKEEIKWTVKEVEQDVQNAILEFKALKIITETAYSYRFKNLWSKIKNAIKNKWLKLTT